MTHRSAVRLQLLTLLTPAALAAQAASGPTVGGYLQVRETYQSREGLTATLKRVRVSLDGSLPEHITYRISAEYQSNGTETTPAGVSLRDAYIRWSAAALTVTAGQLRTPFSREFLTSLSDVLTADRSTVVDSLAPKRDIGLMGQYDVGAAASFMAGVFNGEGQNRVVNKDSTVLVVARATVRPIAALSLGANLAAYGSDSARYGADASLESRGILVGGEYVAQHRLASPNDWGWYGIAACRVLPSLQLVVKQEDFRRPALSAAQRDQATTVGANVYVSGRRVRFIAEYVSRAIGSPAVRKGALIAQLQVRF